MSFGIWAGIYLFLLKKNYVSSEGAGVLNYQQLSIALSSKFSANNYFDKLPIVSGVNFTKS